MTAPDTSPEAIAALMEGVTKAPWAQGKKTPTLVFDADNNPVLDRDVPFRTAERVEANARFIAAAREVVPALAAELALARDRIALMEDDDVRTEAEIEALTAERDAALADVATLKEVAAEFVALDKWITENLARMNCDISDNDRAKIADDVCVDWFSAGIGASFQASARAAITPAGDAT